MGQWGGAVVGVEKLAEQHWREGADLSLHEHKPRAKAETTASRAKAETMASPSKDGKRTVPTWWVPSNTQYKLDRLTVRAGRAVAPWVLARGQPADTNH